MMSFSQKEAEFVDKKRTTTNDNEELENDEELEFSNKYSEESKIDNSINLMNYGSKSEIKDVGIKTEEKKCEAVNGFMSKFKLNVQRNIATG